VALLFLIWISQVNKTRGISLTKKGAGDGQERLISGFSDGEICPLALIFVRTIIGQNNPEGSSSS
jgi:hypothetical protein